MNNYYATVAPGLEAIAARELLALGATEIRQDYGGVHFQGNKELLYRANLWCRTIFRIFVPFAKIKSYNASELYRSVQNIDWRAYLNPDMTLAVNCTGSNKHLNHTHFTALQIKDAIVDWQTKQSGKRSSVDVENPDLLIHAHLDNNRCLLSLDSSGSSLHRRGYRPAMGAAPLKETLAAAILEIAQWTPDLPFVDPMCGSGTLPIEASLKALNIAPGLYREFGFQTWLDFDAELWNKIEAEAEAQQLSVIDVPIIGSDRDSTMLQQAKMNARSWGLEQYIQFSQQEISSIEAPADRGIIICNPPYGKRLGDEAQLGELYRLLGDIFKQKFTGWTAYILTSSKQLSKQVGLRTSSRTKVYNGTISCTLLKYEMY
ncbi:MAG: class I SAM-dependent RNA methyltransferase [Pleurocapsa sp.]